MVQSNMLDLRMIRTLVTEIVNIYALLTAVRFIVATEVQR